MQGDPRTLKYFNGESAVRGKPVVTGTEARLVFRSLFSLIMNRKPERRWRIIARFDFDSLDNARLWKRMMRIACV